MCSRIYRKKKKRMGEQTDKPNEGKPNENSITEDIISERENELDWSNQVNISYLK
jgi:hypothetical protein